MSDDSNASNYSIQTTGKPSYMDRSDLPTKHSGVTSDELPIDDSTVVSASTSDAANGRAQAKEDNRPANKYTGNNMIQTRSLGRIQGAYNKANR